MCQIFLTRDYYVYIFLFSILVKIRGERNNVPTTLQRIGLLWPAMSKIPEILIHAWTRFPAIRFSSSCIRLTTSSHFLRHILKSYVLMSSISSNTGINCKKIEKILKESSIRFNSCSITFFTFQSRYFYVDSNPVMIQYQGSYFNYVST